MKVSVFFDGKNFYSGYRDSGATRRVDFPKLARWLVQKAGGTVLAGCHYYTGIETGPGADAEGQKKLAAFLKGLEVQPGYFVYRFERKARTWRCDKCGESVRFTQEKEVDTTMVADILRLAAVNAFDVAVLVSGDADHAPAVEGVRALGKIIYVASWGLKGMSGRLRKAAFDHLDLLRGLDEFGQDFPSATMVPVPTPAVTNGGGAIQSATVAVTPAAAPPVAAPVPPGSNAWRATSGTESPVGAPAAVPSDASLPATGTSGVATAPPSAGPPGPDVAHEREVDTHFLRELERAETHFRGAYVGLAHFLNSWGTRPPYNTFPASPQARQRALARLLDANRVEIYEVDGKKALRRKG